MAKRSRVNWSDLVATATKFVVAEQKASYEFIRSKLNIGVGTASALLKRLQGKGLVRRGKKRAWIVLVNKDGSAKDPATLPAPRRFRKWRHKVTKAKRTHTRRIPATAPRGKAAKTKVGGAKIFLLDQKIEFLEHLAELAEGKKKALLLEIVTDLKESSKERKFLEALRL